MSFLPQTITVDAKIIKIEVENECGNIVDERLEGLRDRPIEDLISLQSCVSE